MVGRWYNLKFVEHSVFACFCRVFTLKEAERERAEREAEWKEAERKKAEREKAERERREAERKETERREAEQKVAERKETERREVDSVLDKKIPTTSTASSISLKVSPELGAA